jgi:hypothetical protein
VLGPSGCGRAQTGQDSGVDAATSQAADSANVSGSARAAFEFDRGCAHDVDLALAPEAQLEEVGRMCAPGLVKLREDRQPNVATAPAGLLIELSLREHACVRVGVTVRPSEGVTLARLVSPTGSEIAQTADHGVPLLLGREGPVCVGEAGTYRVQVAPQRGTVQAWIGAWAAQTPESEQSAPASSK